ncbi:hypothetical protein ACO0KY_05480 [Undibacterium sp. Dicai25W]|uniref:hypothetical protein n=1 Tax=Undibacterium sp. Dicai25W TaxID=3413034 RepID=UPI003BF43FB5
MSNEVTVLAEIESAFGNVPRPEHFTNFEHCSECLEHDQTLLSCEREALGRDHVGTPGWDPVTFCKPVAKAYLFPALARIALTGQDEKYDWYPFQLLNHLYSGYQYNDFYLYCDPRQRQAIAAFLWHMIDRHAKTIDSYNAADEFIRCHELWSGVEQSNAE